MAGLTKNNIWILSAYFVSISIFTWTAIADISHKYTMIFMEAVLFILLSISFMRILIVRLRKGETHEMYKVKLRFYWTAYFAFVLMVCGSELLIYLIVNHIQVDPNLNIR